MKEVKFTFYNEHSVRKRKPSIGERSVNIPDGSGDRCIFSNKDSFSWFFRSSSYLRTRIFYFVDKPSTKSILNKM